MKKLNLVILFTILLVSAMAQPGVGVGTTIPKAAFNVGENKTVLFGSDTSGSGSKLMWIPSKQAFRVGAIGPLPGHSIPLADGTAWDYDSIGVYSFVAGYQSKATSYGSIAMGAYNNARGNYSMALGYKNFSKGDGSFCVGMNNTSLGSNSVTIGEGNITGSNYSIGIGRDNEVTNAFGAALGFGNINEGYASTTLGYNNHIYSIYSNAIGFGCVAKADQSSAFGLNTQTNSFGSTAIGLNNDTLVGGDPTHWVTSDPLFMIGGGSHPSSRKNVMMILKSGRTGFGTNAPDALLHLRNNGSLNSPQFIVEETGSDYARMNFKNANPGFWNIGAYAQQVFGDNADARFSFYFSMFGANVFTLKGNGDASLAGTLTQYSDARLKQNIHPLQNVISKLMQLNGYTYQWKDTVRGKDKQIGFLAQELEKQFPQLVFTDEKGMKSVAYSNMVPVLLQAIKEQQQQADGQQQQINELKKQIEELKKLIK